jgi:hypothetical protein
MRAEGAFCLSQLEGPMVGTVTNGTGSPGAFNTHRWPGASDSVTPGRSQGQALEFESGAGPGPFYKTEGAFGGPAQPPLRAARSRGACGVGHSVRVRGCDQAQRALWIIHEALVSAARVCTRTRYGAKRRAGRVALCLEIDLNRVAGD